MDPGQTRTGLAQAGVHLSDAEFTRISQAHEQYLAGCAERCHRIDLKNQRWRSFWPPLQHHS